MATKDDVEGAVGKTPGVFNRRLAMRMAKQRRLKTLLTADLPAVAAAIDDAVRESTASASVTLSTRFPAAVSPAEFATHFDDLVVRTLGPKLDRIAESIDAGNREARKRARSDGWRRRLVFVVGVPAVIVSVIGLWNLLPDVVVFNLVELWHSLTH